MRFKKKKNIIPSINTEPTFIKQVIVPVLLHHTCKSVSLKAFIEAHCNNDFSGLIICGQPSQEQLQAAWNEILFDYGAIVKGENSEYLFKLSKEMALLEHHINYVDNAVEFLRVRFDVDIVIELLSMGYSITAEFGTEDYQKQLNLTVSLCKRIVFDLEDMNDEYKRLNNTVTGKKQTEEDYERTIAMLSKYQGYSLQAESTTVLRFVTILNNYLSEQHIMEKQYENYGRG